MTIGICGAGTMGRGIAIACMNKNIPCIVFEPHEAVRSSALSLIHSSFGTLVAKGKMTQDQAETALSLCSVVDSITELRSCSMVIEAIIEQSEAKRELFHQLESIVADECVLATNTSSISIASIARHLRIPQRFVGLHFFNPANIMKLVEIIPGPQTSEQTMKSSVAFAITLGKSPAIAKDVPGFIVNRVARNYYNESQRIVTEGGASIEQVDAIMKSAGFKMGPFELMDLIGVDVNLAVTKSMFEQYFFEPRFQPSGMQQYYVDAGLHGKKSGRGFYDYTSGQ